MFPRVPALFTRPRFLESCVRQEHGGFPRGGAAEITEPYLQDAPRLGECRVLALGDLSCTKYIFLGGYLQ